MDFEKRIKLLLINMRGFAYKAGCRDEAADLTQESFVRCLAKLHANEDYQKRAQEDGTWFEHYIFRTLINLIINHHKRQKKYPTVFKDMDGEQSDLAVDEIVIEEQKHQVMKKFLVELRESLTDEERHFMDLLFQLASESDKINVSNAGRSLTMPPDKAHNTWRRIRAKALDREGKRKDLEDISTDASHPDRTMFHLIENVVYKDTDTMYRQCLAGLTLSDLSLLSRIL